MSSSITSSFNCQPDGTGCHAPYKYNGSGFLSNKGTNLSSKMIQTPRPTIEAFSNTEPRMKAIEASRTPSGKDYGHGESLASMQVTSGDLRATSHKI